MKRNCIALPFAVIVIVNLMFLPLGLIEKISASCFLAEIIFNTFVAPILVSVLTFKDVKRTDNIANCVLLFILNLLILFFGIFIEYLNWGITTGLFFKPDFETIDIIKMEILVSVFLNVLFSVIVFKRRT